MNRIKPRLLVLSSVYKEFDNSRKCFDKLCHAFQHWLKHTANTKSHCLVHSVVNDDIHFSFVTLKRLVY